MAKNNETMRRVGGAAVATVAVFLLANRVWAGPFEDARAQFKSGNYQGALTLLQKAQAERPDDPLIYAAEGNVYRKLNDSADAKQAYDHLLQIDPNLASIPQKSAFARAYQEVGGDPSQIGGAQSASGQNSGSTGEASPEAIIQALSTTGVYVAPGLRDQVDANALAQTVAQAKPRVLKIAAVGHTGDYPNRDALADDLRKRLNVPDDGVVLVATPNGVSGSSGKLSHDEINRTLQQSGIDAALASGGLTAAITTAATALTGNVANDQRKSTVSTSMIALLFFAAIFAIILVSAARKKRTVNDARGPLETMRQKLIADFTYVDGYLDVLPSGADAEAARRHRATAYEAFSTANGVLKVARGLEQIVRAQPLLEQAQRELNDCRASIDRATGGTGVAMSLPSDLPNPQTDEQRGRAYLAQTALRPVEDVANPGERDRLQREIEAIPANERGVSFFSGRPMPASELTPVTMVIGGQKRTVMATRDEAAAIARGQTPSVRAFQDNTGRYTPWYEYRGYDPYRDYYGGWGPGGGLGTLVDLYLLTNILGPATWGGYGPWGYDGFGYGMPMPTYYDNPGFYGGVDNGAFATDFGGNAGGSDFFGGDNSYGGSPEPANAGGFDFFGQNSGDDPGSGFDTSNTDSGNGFDFGGGGDSGGGFDFGGGDSGGGFDFGGGDSGGGFDSGGGGDSGGF